eukprot:scaffold20011_cov33-Tisochrysis_lutea.AAC.7
MGVKHRDWDQDWRDHRALYPFLLLAPRTLETEILPLLRDQDRQDDTDYDYGLGAREAEEMLQKAARSRRSKP